MKISFEVRFFYDTFSKEYDAAVEKLKKFHHTFLRANLETHL